MNLQDLFSMLDGSGYAVISFLISFSWQSAVILAAALASTFVLRKYSAAFRAAILTAVVLTIPLIPLLTSLVAEIELPRAALPVMPVYEQKSVSGTGSNMALPRIEIDPLPLQPVQSEPPFSLSDYPWASYTFIVIGMAAVLMLILLSGRGKIHRWIRRGKPVRTPAVIDAFGRAQHRLGLQRQVVLIVSDQVDTPMVVGVRRPVVLLPLYLIRKLDAEQWYTIALHELIHFKRRDPALFTAVSLIRAICFFNPLVWLAARRIVHLAEQACDEAVLELTNAPIQYAKTLTSMAEHFTRRRFQMELSAGILTSRKVLYDRVKLMLTAGKTPPGKRSAVWLTATLVMIVLAYGIALASPLTPRPAVSVYLHEDTGGGITAGDRDDRPFDRVTTNMSPKEVTDILDDPDEILAGTAENKSIYVWRYRKMLFDSRTILVSFEDDRAKILVSSSKNIKDPGAYIAETEAESAHRKLAGADRIARPPEIQERYDLSYILYQLEDNGAKAGKLDEDLMTTFDRIAMAMPYDDVVAVLGEPQDTYGSSKHETTSKWDVHGVDVLVGFEGNKVQSKTLEKGKLTIEVKNRYWRAENGKTRITVMYDD